MKCLLLCAGYGVRLYPLTRNKPKPLLAIGGIPLLQRTIEKVQQIKQIDRIYLVTNHRFVSHFYYWLRSFQDSSDFKIPIEIFDDMTQSNDDRLGAIGDIEFVIKNAKIDDDLMILAGDNLILFDLREFIDFAFSKKLAVGVKDLKNKELAKLYGCVTIENDGLVSDFEEKPAYPASTLISMGLYYLAKDKLSLFDSYIQEGNNKDAPGFYIQWLHKQDKLFAYTIKGQWFDIGDIDSYNKANEFYGE